MIDTLAHNLEPETLVGIIGALTLCLGLAGWHLLVLLAQCDHWRRQCMMARFALHQAQAAGRPRPAPPTPPKPTRAARVAQKLANLAARSDNPHERALADQLARRHRR